MYNAMVCLNEWPDITMTPLKNMMLICPIEDVFLGSIDTAGRKKDIHYIENEMATHISLCFQNI